MSSVKRQEQQEQTAADRVVLSLLPYSSLLQQRTELASRSALLWGGSVINVPSIIF